MYHLKTKMKYIDDHDYNNNNNNDDDDDGDDDDNDNDNNNNLFMGGLKLYGKSESEIKGLESNVEVFSQDMGMEFYIKNFGVIIMSRGKVKSADGIELRSGEKIREIEEDGYKYLGILEYDNKRTRNERQVQKLVFQEDKIDFEE